MQGEKKGHPISLKVINLSFVIIVIIFSTLVVITNFSIQSKYDQAAVSQQNLIACNDAANTLQRESDQLTLCVNTYVDTQSKDSLEDYYEIIDQRLREKEIERAESRDVDCTALRDALKLSNELAKREAHAFSLIATANGTIKDAPRQVREYQLAENEKKLSYDEKIDYAQSLIHGKEYNDFKRNIYARINTFEREVLSKTERTILLENGEIRQSVVCLHIVAFAGVVLIIFMAVLLYRKVTVVLSGYIKSISTNEHIEENGTAELQSLANEFNKYIDLKNKEQDELRIKAEMDPLTKIPNRSAFEEFMNHTLESDGNFGAFLFLDIDNFKNINDTYGHDMGDNVLLTLSHEMKTEFVGNDYIGRFGGDEFVAWIDGVTTADIDKIESRLNRLNDALLHNKELKIGFSISTGICFAKSGDKYDKILKCADSALYEKKRNGKRGFTVYAKQQTDE